MSSIDFDSARIFLPKYLAEQDTRKLYEEIRKFPTNHNYYTSAPIEPADELVQGDCVRGFTIYNHNDSRAMGDIAGLVVSNSCDIAPENQRNLPVNVLFAPLISLSKFASRLQSAGKDSSAAVEDIRAQRISSMFWLPEAVPGAGETVAYLDQISFQPLASVMRQQNTQRMSSLSQYGFWLLLIKLSIHFSRMGEAITRG